MKTARLKFAVVREDPGIELMLVGHTQARRALVVCSGGCTALTLAARCPSLEVTAFDISAAQLEHLARKTEAVERREHQRLGVDTAGGLNQSGEFEGLFAVLRHFIETFVARDVTIADYFSRRRAPRAAVEAWTSSPYWSTAFALAFSDSLLLTIFGPDAIQHAEPGSYPSYFQKVFEGGLSQDDGPSNPFLQHILLGYYLAGDAPEYCLSGRSLSVTPFHGSLTEVPELSSFDLISLSNIFDWSDDTIVEVWAEALRRQANEGAVVVFRQLNNQRNLRPFFGAEFRFDTGLGQELLSRDRSLFYNRIEVATRVSSGG